MAFKMKGMYHGTGTGSALKFFGLLGGKKEEEPKPIPPDLSITSKKDKVPLDEDKTEEVEKEDLSKKAEEEYKEQILAYGTSNPMAQEKEDTIGEGTRSVINRSKRFNV